jgi:hypothetical protein
VRCGGFTIECISTPSPWRHCRLIRCSQLSDPYPPGGGDGLLARSVAEDLCGFVDAVGRSKKSGAHSLPLPPYISDSTHTHHKLHIYFSCVCLCWPHAHMHMLMLPMGQCPYPAYPSILHLLDTTIILRRSRPLGTGSCLFVAVRLLHRDALSTILSICLSFTLYLDPDSPTTSV